MGAFVISKKLNGQYKFVFTSRKGKVIFSSPGFEDKEACSAAIESLKLILETVTYTRHKTVSGKYFFRMFEGEQQLSVSRKYSTELRLQKGISEIMVYAAKAETLDFSDNEFVFVDFEG